MQPKSIILFFYGYILFFRRQKLNIEKKFKFNDKIQQIPKTKTNKPIKNRALTREI